MLKVAFDRTDLGLFRELEDSVFNGHALLWLVWREPEILAAVVTQLRDTEKGRACIINSCGGKQSREWLPLLSAIENYARAEGCHKMRAFGRKGWIRLLPDFHAPYVVIEKDLS